MSTRKLIGKVSATEKNPSSCDEFQFWMSDDTILSPFDIVLVQNKTDDSITYGVVQDIFHITDGTGHISNYVSSDFGNVDIAPMTHRLSLSYANVRSTSQNRQPSTMSVRTAAEKIGLPRYHGARRTGAAGDCGRTPTRRKRSSVILRSPPVPSGEGAGRAARSWPAPADCMR